MTFFEIILQAIIILKEEADALDTYNRSEKDFIEKAQVKCGAIPSGFDFLFHSLFLDLIR